MKNSSIIRFAAIAATLAGLIPNIASAASPWTARVRATYVDMANRSDAFSALGVNFASNAVHVNSKWIPEVDFSYAFTNNLSAEVILTVPQSQEVTLAGVGKLGKFKHLPPVVTMQYQFAPGAVVQPYAGAGLNFTLIYDTNLSVANVPLALENYSLGLAGQAGVNIQIGNGMHVNLDVKYASLSSDVSVKGGPKLTTARLDPWIYSLGLGWSF